MPSYGISLSDLFLEGGVLRLGTLEFPAAFCGVVGLPIFALDLFIAQSLVSLMEIRFSSKTSYKQQLPVVKLKVRKMVSFTGSGTLDIGLYLENVHFLYKLIFLAK